MNRTTGYPTPKLFILLILFLSLINLTSATTIIGDGAINDTTITSSGLNLTINFTSQLFGGFIIDTNSIYVENLRLSNTTNCQISFNLTNEKNVTYLGTQLPLFTSCGTDSTTISNGLTNPVNASVQLDTGTPNQVGKITSSNGQVYTFSGTTNNPFQLDNLNLDGNTTLTVDNNKEDIKVCNGFFDAGMSYTSFIIILIITLVGGFIILILTTGDSSEIDLTMWALILLVAGAVMSIGMYIITNIGGC